MNSKEALIQNILLKSAVDVLSKRLDSAEKALKYYTHAIKWYCRHDDSSWCSEQCGDTGKRARVHFEQYNDD